MHKQSSFHAELLLVGITLLWGGTFVLIKDAVQIVPPFAFNALRFGVATAVVVALFGKHLRALSTQEVWQGLVLGVLYGVGFFLQTIGLQYTTVARSSFITGSLVVLVPFAYWFVERRRTTPFQKMGVTVAAVGLWLFTNPSQGGINIGDILTFVSAAGWALYICYLDVFTRTVPSGSAFGRTVRLVVFQFGVSFLFGVLGWAILEPTYTPVLTQRVLVAVLYTALLASVVATLVQTHFQHRTTPVKAALIFALEPVFASAIAFIAIGEQMGWREISGAGCILGGVLLGEIGDAIFARRTKENAA